MTVSFRWSPWKAEENLRKHGVAFEDAALVFNDPRRATRLDQHPHEERWQTIGIPSGAFPMVLLVVHVDWVSEDDGH